MEGWIQVAKIAGVLSGLGFLRPDLLPATLLATSLAVNTCNAVLCRILARNRGFGRNLWTSLGFVFGPWAVVVLMFSPKRGRRR